MPKRGRDPAGNEYDKAPTHHLKRPEQLRLRDFGGGVYVSGSTHESEHVVGHNIAFSGMGRKSGEGKKWEQRGNAYQEVKPAHRAHAGTGTGTAYNQYNREQTATLETATKTSASNAVQLNQLYYAHGGDNFNNYGSKAEQVQSDASFHHMVDNMESIPTRSVNGDVTYHTIGNDDKLEMHVARELVRNSDHVTKMGVQIASARERFASSTKT